VRRYLLPVLILICTIAGVTAIVRGKSQARPAEPREQQVAAAPPSSTTQGGPTAVGGPPAVGGVLTTGPLMATSAPTRVSIPALKVAVPVIGLGQQADGSMAVPGDAKTVGWYTKAPTPGALGPAVLAGHVDFKKRPGTFARLSTLKSGDTVTVEREDGSMAMFAVTKVERYPKDRFPSDAVYGAINFAGLRLITCGGDFDSTAGHYEDNIVVYAALRMAHPATS
jgi:Sortase domain